MRLASPLRYPGGKSILAGFLTDVIDLNELRGCVYYEAYAGGAGAALSLLRDGVVSEIFINDADERIYAFWHSVLNKSDSLVNEILSVPLTIDEWHQKREVCANPSGHSRFEVGFAAFYMNRCNRSGVLTGAGPIGGHEQNGKWRLNVRFNREPLVERILTIARLKERIHLTHLDALKFLKTCLPGGRGRGSVFVYLDPPYVNKGQRLYLNAYNESDHAKLARYIQSQATLPWIMSYDDTALVRNLYATQQVANLPIRYSLQEKRSARELIIAPHHLALPLVCRINGQESHLTVNRHQRKKL
jgi:DNA adenine methylase